MKYLALIAALTLPALPAAAQTTWTGIEHDNGRSTMYGSDGQTMHCVTSTVGGYQGRGNQTYTRCN